MKFKHFQAPVLFSSTFKALNLREKNSSTFKDAWEPCIFLHSTDTVGRMTGMGADQCDLSCGSFSVSVSIKLLV